MDVERSILKHHFIIKCSTKPSISSNPIVNNPINDIYILGKLILYENIANLHKNQQLTNLLDIYGTFQKTE